MLTPQDIVCQNNAFNVVGANFSSVLVIIYGFNSAFISASNLLLIIGFYLSKRKKVFSRNDRLVLALSTIDLVIGLVQLPLQIFFILASSKIGCVAFSIRGFLVMFLPTTSAGFVLLIAVDRFMTVLHKNRNFVKLHFVLSIVSIFVISFVLGLWYALVVTSNDLHRKSLFFLGNASFELVALLIVTTINVSLLVDAKKILRRLSRSKSSKSNFDKRLTHTIIIISITLVISYSPSVMAQYYIAIVMAMEDMASIPVAKALIFWTLAPTQLNSGLNALIYISRNKSMLRLFRRRKVLIKGEIIELK